MAMNAVRITKGFIFGLMFCFVQSHKKDRPHIIFIVADDLGWNDVSFHGSNQIPTPNIDALANDGVILNNYYVSPLCTPSRGSLLTGKYPIRLGLQHYVIDGDAPWGLPLEEKTMPEYLGQLDYVSHGVGKWHLGFFEEQYLPTKRGFESFFGYWTGKGDYYSHFSEMKNTNGLDFHNNDVNAWAYNGYYSTELFTAKAKSIISQHNISQPLFLYLAHQAVHGGNSYATLQAPPEYTRKFSYIKDNDRRTFAGMVSALDRSIGQIFAALEEAKMLDNVIIVFTTDNGGAVEGIDGSTGSNWPLRGSKYNMWEGGVRGIAWVWSSLLRPSKHVATQLMHVSDWLPTLYAAAGGDVGKLGKLDGFNLWPTICNDGSSPRNEILHNIDPLWQVEAIRKNQYKLLKGSVFNGHFDGWFDQQGKKTVRTRNFNLSKKQLKIHRESKKALRRSQVTKILLRKFGKPSILVNHTTGTSQVLVKCGQRPANASENCKPMKSVCLFDVENDPCEFNNLAGHLPGIVQQLEDILNKYRTEAVPPRNLPSDPNANPKYHGYAWVPWK